MKKYFSQIKSLPQEFSFHTGWKSPSNIALVKYWGKRGKQLPMNTSLSMTLQNAFSKTWITVKPSAVRKIEFYFDNNKHDSFLPKIEKFLDRIQEYMPYMNQSHLLIESENSFPHSAGIASSASAMSSLALALTELDEILTEKKLSGKTFYKKASFLARLGSGSASRSVFPEFSFWGHSPEVAESSDEYAIGLTDHVDPIFKNFKDTILIVSSKPKPVSSSTGHDLMENHHFREARITQANQNSTELLNILRQGDLLSFNELVEHEALMLHGLMMSSKSPYILLQPNTLAIIDKIRAFRKQTSLPLCFTLDAGPNVHVLYPEEYYGRIRKFISDELALYCENGYQLDDENGKGPEKLNL